MYKAFIMKHIRNVKGVFEIFFVTFLILNIFSKKTRFKYTVWVKISKTRKARVVSVVKIDPQGSGAERFAATYRRRKGTGAGAALSRGFWVEPELFFCPAPAPTPTPTLL